MRICSRAGAGAPGPESGTCESTRKLREKNRKRRTEKTLQNLIEKVESHRDEGRKRKSYTERETEKQTEREKGNGEKRSGESERRKEPAGQPGRREAGSSRAT